MGHFLCRLVADEVVEGGQTSFRSFAHCHHDLLVRHIGDIAGGEHAGQVGATFLVGGDLAVLGQREMRAEIFMGVDFVVR